MSNSKIRHIVSKGPKYRFSSRIGFGKCREEIASALRNFGGRWCEREHVEPHALKTCRVNIFKKVDKLVEFYSQKY